ncbi:fimbrial assembly protein piln, putative [Heliomicrobium modesticaldum Ice1]|uniref:Fimbrial assembly protein piln, putative n=1 Tax=Heliobacterium modesticaldum (strain ATCC 51547 / Ice1) TaxID=498761 RepID=B0TEG1_HELMI|nr:PilN domain-containing protein [Heliomicrobium modesticaldum]ABZ82880.1 fimbrial assembly protein piln, putative [Heliomicrobium modesticaldum Ice1]
MAEINLLPSPLRAKGRGVLRRLALSLVLCSLAAVLLYAGAERQMSRLVERAEIVETEAGQLASRQAQEQEKKRNRQEESFLTALLRESPRWSERLRDLDDALSEGPLRLTAIMMEGDALLLEGSGSRLCAVGDFMDKLKGTAGFSEVSLLDGTYEEDGAVTFRLYCRLPGKISPSQWERLSEAGKAGKGGLNDGGAP